MGESGRGGKQRKAATGVSWHSPSPDYQTRCCVWACARCGMDSWPSKKPLNKRKIKGVDTDLEIQLPEVIEEHFNPVVVLCLVQDDKLHVCFLIVRNEKARGKRPLTAGGDEGRNDPFVKLVHRLEIHRVLSPHHLLDGVQARIRNHLDNVSVLSPSHPHSTPSARVIHLRCARCSR
jgi:hypothetical protein